MVQLKSVSPLHVAPALALLVFLAWNVCGQVLPAEGSYATHPVVATAENAAVAEITVGNKWTITGNWLEAAAAYRRASQLDPRSATAFGNLGHAYSRLNQLEEARDSLQHALDLAPNNAVFAYNLGNIYLKLGKPAKSIESLQLALKLRPHFFEALNDLGTRSQNSEDTLTQSPPSKKQFNFVQTLAWLITTRALSTPISADSATLPRRYRRRRRSIRATPKLTQI